MKLKIAIAALMIFSGVAWTYPASLRLVSPNRLERVRGNRLTITIKLPCTNSSALDWSDVVMTNDDSGDRLAVVVVVVAMSECKKGPAKEFNVTVDPKDFGYEFEGSKVSDSFIPATLEK